MIIVEQERLRIGKRIAAIRSEKNLSQSDLAKLTGMTPGNISRIESGRYSTGIDILSRIADVLGYRLEFEEKRGT